MPELSEIARKNFTKKGLDYLTVYTGDAVKFDDIDDYNYFFFYNPFTGTILDAVVKQLGKSLNRNPRKITLLYQNPQGRDLFINSGLFPYIVSCFVPSLINFDKNNRRYMRQFIDIYCTEPLRIDFAKHGIKIIE
ncbi:hypothetical protein AGMMS49579_25760 [Spirochaetia bacterium]|nr:hypothetical protein AGMMS49579_25760 [Spirochaetia bacterium]